VTISFSNNMLHHGVSKEVSNVDITRAWESIRENVRTSTRPHLGYC